MLSQEQVIAAVTNGRTTKCIDSRDYGRLTRFFSSDQWGALGFELASGATPPEPVPWTEDEIKKRLADDLAFGFEKALDQRGISAGLMYEVVKMWMWILEDDLQNFDDYPLYGLPLFKAVAVKYGLDNPIGADSGSEAEYDVQE